MIDHAPRRDDRFEVTIEELSADGMGRAKLELELGPQRAHRRYELRVLRALPGEHVLVRIVGRRRRIVLADVEQILTPSALRIEARCRHFEQRDPGDREAPCGGCALQSVSYADQLQLKRARIQRALEEAGLEPGIVAPVLGLEQPWHYRNKMELSFHHTREGSLVLGLHPPGRRGVVLGLQQCFLLSPFASAFVPEIAAWSAAQGLSPYQPRNNTGWLRTLTLREGKRTGERLLELTTSGDDVTDTIAGTTGATEVAAAFAAAAQAIAGRLGQDFNSIVWTQQYAVAGTPTRFVEHNLVGPGVLHEELQIPDHRSLRFEIHPRAFFQPNTLQAERLYAEVLRACGETRTTAGPRNALDLYCGTGTIALCLASIFDRVVGVELQPRAVENACRNATLNGLHNCQFYAGDAAALLASGTLFTDGVRPDTVVVDPPRAGLSPQAVELLGQLAAPVLVYASCEPSSLARDLAALRRLGYHAQSIQPVDQFPHTMHVESVARLIYVS